LLIKGEKKNLFTFVLLVAVYSVACRVEGKFWGLILRRNSLRAFITLLGISPCFIYRWFSIVFFGVPRSGGSCRHIAGGLAF